MMKIANHFSHYVVIFRRKLKIVTNGVFMTGQIKRVRSTCRKAIERNADCKFLSAETHNDR